MAKRPLPLPLHRHQVAGKLPMLWNQGRICKPAFPHEVQFYQELPKEFPDLAPFVPKFHGLLKLDSQADCVDSEALQNILETAERQRKLFHEQYSSAIDVDDVESPLASRSDSERDDDDICSDVILNRNLSAVDSWKLEPESSPEAHLLPNDEGWQQNAWSSVCFLRRKPRHDSPGNNLYIALEDMTRSFKRPCILDLKVGTRAFGNDATPAKVRAQKAKSKSTTSYSVGLRLCGMQVFQVSTRMYRCFDKYFGRLLEKRAFKKILAEYFHNGLLFRADVIPCFISRLESLIKTVESQTTYRFYSSSVLLVYEGDVVSAKRPRRSSSSDSLQSLARGDPECKEAPHERSTSFSERSPVNSKTTEDFAPPDSMPFHHTCGTECNSINLKLIDFANIVKTEKNCGRDEGLLKGLTNLHRYLKKFLQLYFENVGSKKPRFDYLPVEK